MTGSDLGLAFNTANVVLSLFLRINFLRSLDLLKEVRGDLLYMRGEIEGGGGSSSLEI